MAKSVGGTGDGLTDIIWIPPLEPALKVVVVLDHTIELLQQLVGLVLVDLVNALGKLADRVNTLPAGHRVRPHDRMDSSEVFPLVKRASPLPLLNLLAPALNRHSHAVSTAGHGQTIHEVLVRLGQAVVDLVARSPQRVAARLGQLDDTERRVVGGDGLELDVGVPLGRVEAALVHVGHLLEHVLEADRVDVADVSVWRAALGHVGWRQRKDVHR